MLAAAQARCLAAGEQWTASRRRTYELLVADGVPIKAYDLIARFKDHDSTTKPPTVYRALDVLMQLGLVHRVTSLGAFIACRGGAVAHQAEFLICDCCGYADEVTLDTVQLAEALALPHGFQVERLLLEIHGLCPACQAAAPPPSTF